MSSSPLVCSTKLQNFQKYKICFYAIYHVMMPLLLCSCMMIKRKFLCVWLHFGLLMWFLKSIRFITHIIKRVLWCFFKWGVQSNIFEIYIKNQNKSYHKELQCLLRRESWRISFWDNIDDNVGWRVCWSSLLVFIVICVLQKTKNKTKQN